MSRTRTAHDVASSRRFRRSRPVRSPPQPLASPVSIRVDDWVLPSHAQAERVTQGSLDLAVAWVTDADATEFGLEPYLLRAEPLRVLAPKQSIAGPVPAAQVTALVHSDSGDATRTRAVPGDRSHPAVDVVAAAPRR
jgi:hypothetical protein